MEGAKCGDGDPLDIYVMEADGTNPRRLTNSGAAAVGAPAWSPDGNLIAYNATIHQTESGFGQFEIYVMASDGSGTRRVTHLSHVRRALRFPTWSSDGQKIAFESQVEVEDGVGFIFRIYVVNVDGSDAKEIDFGRGVRSPKWAPK